MYDDGSVVPPGLHVLSMRDEVFIVSPKRENFGSLEPMSPLEWRGVGFIMLNEPISTMLMITALALGRLSFIYLKTFLCIPYAWTSVNTNTDDNRCAIVRHQNCL